MAPDDLIYHYTGLRGLIGIVTSGKIWATDIRFLNDTGEATYARRAIAKHIQAYGDTKGTAGDLANRVLASWTGWPWSERYFVACFCKKDDLLSQWRGYARLGYSIGFDRRTLAAFGTHDPLFNLHDMLYRDADLSNEVDKAVKGYEGAVAGRTTPPHPSYMEPEMEQALLALTTLVDKFKNKKFEQEEEVRAVHIGLPHCLPQIRNSNLGPTPYVPLNIGQRAASAIGSVTVGPTSHSGEAVIGVTDLLRANSLTADVKPSEIPFRTVGHDD